MSTKLQLLENNKKAENFISEAMKVHGNKYDYSESVYVNASTKIIINCFDHGKFLQLPRRHISGQQCPKCAHENCNNYRKLDLKTFLDRVAVAHGDRYDYNNIKLNRVIDKIDIICKVHGSFAQTVISHLKGHGCPLCNKSVKSTSKSTPGAKLIYDTSWFIGEALEAHGDRYDYSQVNYIKSHLRVKIGCKIHGIFEQAARDHLNGDNCIKCSMSQLSQDNARSQDEFISLVRDMHHNKYDYSNTTYVNKASRIIIACPIHGQFNQIAHNHLRGQGCPACGISIQQQEVIDYVKSFGLTVAINDRIRISPLEIDCLIDSHSLGIELHGIYWHSYDQPETRDQQFKHYIKATAAIDAGIKLLQIFENEWIDKNSLIKSIIKHKLNINSNKIYARSLSIRSASRDEAIEFYSINHLQGSRDGIHYAALNGNKILAMMSFCSHQEYQFELLRYAVATDCSVVGGASRLLAAFVHDHSPKSLLSYADRRYSDGNLYKTLGFNLINITDPGYYYVKGSKVFRRQQFQKHKLATRLENFNESLSEPANMFANGYRRLWDAGHYKFVKVF